MDGMQSAALQAPLPEHLAAWDAGDAEPDYPEVVIRPRTGWIAIDWDGDSGGATRLPLQPCSLPQRLWPEPPAYTNILHSETEPSIQLHHTSSPRIRKLPEPAVIYIRRKTRIVRMIQHVERVQPKLQPRMLGN